MKHNLNNSIIKSYLSLNDSSIIGSVNEQIEMKTKENSERLNRIEKLIIENKELYFQCKYKAEWAAELFIANREFTFQIEEKVDRRKL